MLVSDACPARPSGAFPAVLGGPPLLQRTATAMQVSWMEAAQSLRRMILGFGGKVFPSFRSQELGVDCRSGFFGALDDSLSSLFGPGIEGSKAMP